MKKLKCYLKEYHPIVHSLIFGTVLISLTSSMSLPFLAIYLSGFKELSFSKIGFIIGVGSLAGTFCGLIGGVLSDFIGRNKLLILSLLGLGVAFIGFISTSNLGLLISFSIVRGVSQAFFGTISKALMADFTPESKRFRMFSNRYFASNLGFAAGPVIGALLGIGGNMIAFVLTSVIYFGYALSLMMMLKSVPNSGSKAEVHDEERIHPSLLWKVLRSDVPLLLFIIGGILLTTVHGQMSVTLSQYLQDHFMDGVTLFALLMSLNGVTVILFQLPLSRWSERYSLFHRILLGCILFACGEIGFAFSSNWALFIVSMFIFTLGEILVIPAEYAQVDEITPNELRGTYYGAQSLNEFGNFLGPWFGGVLLTRYNGTVMFLFMGCISLVSVYFFFAGKRRYNKKTKSAIDSGKFFA
ncbi:MFS transporter [Paenibacillus donghaensis]|uniref:MDR family MFS transporter n=1 Tax=Paenibacillus donghaensis TaxID=414771 RepID=UPI00188324DF|nr:MFS transporter [Paenibacillus donghaensis]MBE9917891.1 MFS transporter [Paenibacillus donghaensis]